MKQIVTLFLLFPLLIWSQVNFDTAEKLFKEEKFDQARPLFESIVKENPSNLKAIEYLGDIAGYSKAWDKAIGYYKKLKSLKPTEANYYYKYGGALGMKATKVNKFRALGMIGEVRSSFEKAIALDPKHIEARWALIELNLQLPGIVGGSQSVALKYSDELLKLSPIDGFLSKGHINEYFKRYTDAEQQYKRAIAVSGSKTSYQMLANLYKNKMNNPEKAKAVLDEYQKKR
ncbi:tetratricopeptide repeat protein [Flavobacterium restrictum]|uniref:Tetratricopeptide repeat protein n=1 Tax=Flavobacterium restrictum TaxID=2594428 RepID=A0A553E509_9FLAO|nr:tetratricopeptide repeat protein [Flavobacterium restrictum]TRX40055.1 tetratricopeptide repeat protein [Flavobacterium restrictum]